MSDAAVSQVEDLLKDCLEQYAPLEGWSILTNQSDQIAVDLVERGGQVIIIRTITVELEIPPETNLSQHVATFQFDIVSRKTIAGEVSRINYAIAAHIVAALLASSNLGGQVEDIEPMDVATGDGKDFGEVSLQARINFFTPYGDWFTLSN